MLGRQTRRSRDVAPDLALFVAIRVYGDRLARQVGEMRVCVGKGFP